MGKVSNLPDRTFELVYKGTDHGFGSKNFYDRVKNVQPIIVLIKNSLNMVFGGFTNLSYIEPLESEMINHKDSKAAVFSLTNRKIFRICEGFKTSTYTCSGH